MTPKHIVTTAAYRAFIERNALSDFMAETLADARAENIWSELRSASHLLFGQSPLNGIHCRLKTFRFVQLVANLLSPILGSVITKQLGWPWIFHITLVMVLIAILLVALDNKKTSSTNAPVRWTEIDILGGVL